jgi:hypothetical protein
MAGGLLAPPFFKGQIVKKTLSAKNLKKFLSLLLDLFFVRYDSIFYQNHLVCLQNTFEKTYPESRGPKGSCHILCWFDVYILQNNITPGRLRFRPIQWRGSMAAAEFRKQKQTSKKNELSTFTFGFQEMT